MLSTIDLDHHSKLVAGKVREVLTDRGLTPEVMRLERRLTQLLPKPFLGFSHVTAQRSGARHAFVHRTLGVL
jgi:hypothetical protein